MSILKSSVTRTILLVWYIGVFLVWAFLSIKNSQLTDIPYGLAGVLGLIFTGKVVQFYKEIPNSEQKQ